MKFSIPTNWQKDLVLNIRRDCIDDLYGQLASDLIGGGRASYALPQISKKKIASHIQEIHNKGLRFTYLLNATCLDNKEWTSSGQKRIHRLLDWLVSIGVDSVIVAVPYLLQLIKKQYPMLKASVSALAGVNSIERAKYWQELGADEICLFGPDVNRNFNLLQRIRKNVKSRLILIANNACLYRCPFFIYHGTLNSHASQAGHWSRGFMIDYCRLSCDYRRILEPVNFIRADWIRPEDIHYYEEVGVDKIKFVDRSMKTSKIVLIVNAYTNRSYAGNLLDLFLFPSQGIAFSKWSSRLKYFLHPFTVNLIKLYRGKSLLGEMKIYIDNKKLDGFIKNFLNEDCSLKSCQECGYCEEVSKKVVKIEPEYRDKTLKNYREFLDSIISSEIFRI